MVLGTTEPMVTVNGIPTFKEGDRVRIQKRAKKYPEFPYSGDGLIGKITMIARYSIVIESGLPDESVRLDDIFIIKRVPDEENFNNTPYIDEAEREFWENYWMTPDGIKEKTAEDKAMLRKFAEDHA